jgi:hypothetical protein
VLNKNWKVYKDPTYDVSKKPLLLRPEFFKKIDITNL